MSSMLMVRRPPAMCPGQLDRGVDARGLDLNRQEARDQGQKNRPEPGAACRTRPTPGSAAWPRLPPGRQATTASSRPARRTGPVARSRRLGHCAPRPSNQAVAAGRVASACPPIIGRSYASKPAANGSGEDGRQTRQITMASPSATARAGTGVAGGPGRPENRARRPRPRNRCPRRGKHGRQRRRNETPRRRTGSKLNARSSPPPSAARTPPSTRTRR